jgi:hypothetical protein
MEDKIYKFLHILVLTILLYSKNCMVHFSQLSCNGNGQRCKKEMEESNCRNL